MSKNRRQLLAVLILVFVLGALFLFAPIRKIDSSASRDLFVQVDWSITVSSVNENGFKSMVSLTDVQVQVDNFFYLVEVGYSFGTIVASGEPLYEVGHEVLVVLYAGGGYAILCIDPTYPCPGGGENIGKDLSTAG